MLTAFTNVTFIDIRPLEAKLDRLECIKGNILSMPFEDKSLRSLSCLCVAEHIGLGRYGDSLDPMGTKKAIKELSRVLAVNGNLYFSVPVADQDYVSMLIVFIHQDRLSIISRMKVWI